ncbi:MAG: tRNA lysidine(34) synthetase TilS [Acidimicrobiales bacterium]|jgi:tRNA(Ile)-lysidine synthase
MTESSGSIRQSAAGPPDLSGDPVVGALLGRCTFPPVGSPLVCGVSGGPDSLALLVLAVAAGCTVTAVHVDHGLRPGSDTESSVVAAAAARFGAGFRSCRVEVADGPNLEARARSARHGVLGDGAATGHTADDQAETVLVNLLRGAGVHGLAGMRAGRTHPLLALRRSETVALCAHVGLEPIRDPSNDDPRFVRNRVRAELLPLCSDIAGRDVVPVLARQAALLAGDAELLDSVGSLLDPTDAAALASAPAAQARRAVRSWLAGDDRYPPPAEAVERVLEVARSQRRATEVPGGIRVARSGGRLRMGPVGGATGPPVQS